MNKIGISGTANGSRTRQGSAKDRIAETTRGTVILLLLFLGYAVCSSQAQLYTGSITGVVTDASGGVLPGAKVALLDEARGTSSTATSDSAGRYLFRSIQPGSYTVTVAVANYETERKPGIVVDIDQNAAVNFSLKVGSVSTVVDVEGSSVQLDTEDATTGQVIDRTLINELPLNGRAVLDLSFLAPGVTQVNDSTSTGGNNFISDGGRNNTADLLIDGVSASNFEQNSGVVVPTYTPSVDAVEEFKIQQTNFSAEFGFSGGTIINLIERSGTNQLHGSAYEFARNAVFDANNYFNNASGIPIPSLQQHQFGGTFGGPIRKSKMFFFVDYEGLRASTGATAVAGVPTPAERTGGFGQLCTLQGGSFDGTGKCSVQAGQLYDPFTGSFQQASTDANGNTLPAGAYRTGFIPYNNLATYSSPGNPNLPSSLQPGSGAGNLIDPAAFKLLQFFPQPTVTATTYSQLFNNWFGAGVNTTSQGQFDIKIDQDFSDRDRLSIRYSQLNGSYPSYNCFNNAADGCSGGDVTNTAHLVAINNTHTFSPTVVLTTSYGFSRGAPFEPNVLGNYPNVNPIQQLGLPSYVGDSGVRAYPAVTLTGYTPANGFANNIGTQTFSRIREGQETHTLLGGISWLRGKHDLKFGADGRLHRINYTQPGWPAGAYTYDYTSTSQSPVQGSGGDALASFLTGILPPAGGAIYEIPNEVSTQSFQFSGYVQDNFRATPKLTLNLGLRYEVSLPRTERYNRINSVDPNVASPLALSAAQLSQLTGLTGGVLRGGEIFAGPGNRYTYGTDFRDFAPRFGFAFQLSHSLVVRGGYGIYYSIPRSGAAGTGATGYQGYDQLSYPIATYNNDGATPYARFSNPFPNGGPTLPPGNSLGLFNDIGNFAQGPIPSLDTKTPYEQSWTFGLQKQFPWKLLFDVTYIGKKGTHLYLGGAGQLNHLPEVSQLPTSQIAALANFVPNPFYDPNSTCDPTHYICDPNSILSQPTVQAYQLALPFPQFQGFSGDSPPTANSIYHAAQLRLQKPFSNGLELLVTYTFSKSIDDASVTDASVQFFGGAPQSATLGPTDPNNYPLDRSVSAFDIPNTFTASYVYQLPVGQKRAFFNGVNHWVNGFIGGWQTQGIISLSDGTPTYPLLIGGTPIPTYGPLRPEESGNLECNNSFSNPFTDNYYANPDVLSTPAPYTLGNAPRTITSCRRPANKNLDASISKEFSLASLREGSHLEFRFETFNTFNHPVFAGPNSTVNSGSFGQVTSTANNPRNLQFALKFYW